MWHEKRQNFLVLTVTSSFALVVDLLTKQWALLTKLSTVRFNPAFSIRIFTPKIGNFWFNLLLFGLGVVGVAWAFGASKGVRQRWSSWVALGVIVGGASGNLVEYLGRGQITDFIPLWLPVGGVWGYANLGDFFVWLGMGWFCVKICGDSFLKKLGR